MAARNSERLIETLSLLWQRAQRLPASGRGRARLLVLSLGILSALVPTPTRVPAEASTRPVDYGAQLFVATFTPEQGLGPLYNAQSCAACHNSPTVGGMGRDVTGVAVRVARVNDDGVDLLVGRGGPFARAHSVAELGRPCSIEPGAPPEANLVSLRNAPALYGLGLIDAIPDETILAGAVARENGIQGRAQWVQGADGGWRVGRFGWKADTATLDQFVADAMRNELGITNPLAPRDWVAAPSVGGPRCAGDVDGLDDDGRVAAALTAFVASLSPPAPPSRSDATEHGRAVFGDIGCAVCHTPSVAAGGRELWLYSDLLLHDLGPDLDDSLPQGLARGRDWRTTPLWGLGNRTRFLHDARARTSDAAIRTHGGEATAASARFRGLTATDREALLDFLASL